MTKEQIRNRAAALQTLKGQVAALQEQIEVIEQSIKLEMLANDNTVIEDDDYRFRHTDYTAKGLDQKRLKEERPEIYAEYITDRNCKRFTFTVFES